jgi:hypothetical protein
VITITITAHPVCERRDRDENREPFGRLVQGVCLEKLLEGFVAERGVMRREPTPAAIGSNRPKG